MDIAIPAQQGYKRRFLYALVAVSAIPAIVAIINFDVLNGAVYQFALMFSLLSIMSGAHVWMNLAYFFSARWRAHFRRHPFEFYVAPALIFFGTFALMAQPNKTIGMITLYGVTFVNLWHHSKQNWGILSIIGKVRGSDVSGLRKPLIYAWPFFVVPWMLQVPPIVEWAGQPLLFNIAVTSAAAFLLFCLYEMTRSGFFKNRDPLVIVAGVVLACYFVPLVAMYGKPYALFIWAAAHALQYYLMVFSSLSFKARETTSTAAIWRIAGYAALVLAALTCISWWASKTASSADMWLNLWPRMVFGAILGVNLVHFWVDAFIWKFSDKEVRNLHGAAFKF